VDDLARYIKNTRLKRGMTLRGFARDVGVAPSFVTDIEAGRRLPGMGTMGKLAEVLGVPLADMQALDPRLSYEYAEAARLALAGDRELLDAHLGGLGEDVLERIRRAGKLLASSAHSRWERTSQHGAGKVRPGQ